MPTVQYRHLGLRILELKELISLLISQLGKLLWDFMSVPVNGSMRLKLLRIENNQLGLDISGLQGRLK